MMAKLLFALVISSLAAAPLSCAFVSPSAPLTQFKSSVSSLNHHYYHRRPLSSTTSLRMSSNDGDGDVGSTDEEGADLAAQFFQAMKDRNINISLEGDEVEDDEIDSSPASASSGSGGDLDDSDDAILREYDVSMTERASLTNEQIYDEVKDRVFESAGAFVEYTKGVNDDADGEYDDSPSMMVYTPPQKVPDSGLTAGEVVELGEWSVHMMCLCLLK